jgi:hypothetical protein
MITYKMKNIIDQVHVELYDQLLSHACHEDRAHDVFYLIGVDPTNLPP